MESSEGAAWQKLTSHGWHVPLPGQPCDCSESSLRSEAMPGDTSRTACPHPSALWHSVSSQETLAQGAELGNKAEERKRPASKRFLFLFSYLFLFLNLECLKSPVNLSPPRQVKRYLLPAALRGYEITEKISGQAGTKTGTNSGKHHRHHMDKILHSPPKVLSYVLVHRAFLVTF